MSQHLVGVLLKDKNFVPLCSAAETDLSKPVFAYKGDFDKSEIPVYICKMKSEKDIEKIYKIGELKISDFYLEQLKLNEQDNREDKKVIKIISTLSDSGDLAITLDIGDFYVFKPLKVYEANIFEELAKKEFEERENSLLDYGDFIKCSSSSGFLLPEEDLTAGGNQILKAREIEVDDKHSGKKAKKADAEKDEYYELAGSATRTRFTIGGKLIAMITFILLVAVSTILYLVSYYVSKDVLKNAEMNNFSVNEQTSNSIQKKIENISDNALLFLSLYFSSIDDPKMRNNVISNFFERNQDIVALFLPEENEILNNKFLVVNGISKENILNVISANKSSIENAKKGLCEIKNVSHILNTKTAALFFPVEFETAENPELHFEPIAVIFSTDFFEGVCGTNSIYTNFIVDKDGCLLSGLDSEKVLNCQSADDYEVVHQYLNSSANNAQIRFVHDDTDYYGAFKRLDSANCGVITLVPTSIVLEPVFITIVRNAYLALAVLALTVIVIWFFAKSISNPIKALSVASLRIKNGDYKINIKPHTHDELALLTTSFVDMSKGLAERERLKDSFGRFTNKAVAEKAMRGELVLGGETKFVTIFFSDIRSFTAISDKLSANQVVDFLNEYMTRMVKCVTATGGFIDKYIGDAIMATWGTPISTGTPKQDAINSIRCALMMRSELISFNKDRGTPDKPIIKIGCGINSGNVVAGQIGSSERMEYTCIGDTVNVASRTESLNKPFCTDILITEDTYQLVKDVVTVEKMRPVKVKGKENPMDMYAVINMPDEQDIPGAGPLGFKTLAQVREALGFAEPQLDGVDLNEEEKKFKIQG